jgi:D-alanyl-lipoteichoic acid acyltransferase DltB (MBOAT superfamily)
MLFNSYEFICAFLPLTLLGFFVLGSKSRYWALSWLIVASFFFYAWWRPLNVLIIAPSIIVNYVLGRWLLRLGNDKGRASVSHAVLFLGIVFNIAFLGYFKYINFLTTVVNDLAGTSWFLSQVILPLGISFITFQKIAFLIDVHGKRIESFSLHDYCLFVLFFPPLIAGPIVHFREIMPQFRAISCRFSAENLSVGLTLFFCGLFKKVVLADGIAAYVTPIYELSAAGGAVSLFPAWAAAVGFTLQIYFDFSGYSDMALGLSRCFGVRLPPNFDSPLKAASIIDFWLRWHMTLTRFLTAYLYNPLVLWLTRRRLAKGLGVLGGRDASLGTFLHLLAGPLVLTMFVSGLWHGAGYPFILWGLLHGFYLAVNHAWRLYSPGLWSNRESYARYMGPIGSVLTFCAVVVSMVLFRSPTVEAASELLMGMAGLHGVSLPEHILARFGPFAESLQHVVSVSSAGTGAELVTPAARWIIALLGIALLLPNSLQLLARYEPALGVKQRSTERNRLAQVFAWRPTLPWSVAVSLVAGIAILRLGGRSEFLYWQF